MLYGSSNIEICLQECRLNIIDEIYLAKLIPKSKLKILDLSTRIIEEDNEFESLNLTLNYIFCAEKHAYKICRQLAKYAYGKGYDGIIYPSYFSQVKPESIPNIALFNSPIKDGKLKVSAINRILLNQIDYKFSFGPIFQ